MNPAQRLTDKDSQFADAYQLSMIPLCLLRSLRERLVCFSHVMRNFPSFDKFELSFLHNSGLVWLHNRLHLPGEETR